MRILNIGILAHVDAGKTSLTERLLFDTGVIDRLGSVDAGSTRTDTAAVERQRGITVRSAVVSFAVGDTQVNVVDTPGHSDFAGEVERALGVLDGAVLVLSAVEGVQARTRILLRVLRELRLPTLLFINKIDRAGARAAELLAEVERCAPVVPMAGVHDIGTPDARAVPVPLDAEALAERDDELLARVLDGPPPTPAELRVALADQTARCAVHPVFFGSAITGQGVPALIDGITGLLPPAREEPATAPQGSIFAIERRSGRKTAYLRLFSGELTARQRVTFRRETGEELAGRLTGLEVVGRAAERMVAGDIARITGFPGIRVGDRLGDRDVRSTGFSRPTLRTVVSAREPAEGPKLHAALQQLAEQDPLIEARTLPGGADEVLLHGEVQKEVIAAALADDFGVVAAFGPSQVVLLERPTGVGEAVEEMGHRAAGPSGFWATIGLRVRPTGRRTGVVFEHETELGALPPAFHRAVEESVHAAMARGLHGWAVTDCAVTMTRSGFAGPVTTAADFRGLVPLVLRRALERAGTRVYEPCHEFVLEVPLDVLAEATARLSAHRAEIAEAVPSGATWSVRGTIPACEVPEVQRWLPDLSRGEGTWWSRPDGDRPM
ncbi:ribosomal protection tetracycline resistance protein [Saccharopolyspora kobensis]|uniref:Ribosomal protection tetracycline resistance protein n=1 Tax=Saccharopolyspora kobensis TaxID=146035 RepID=A0A1H6EGJ6_9PSEU|nr:TetM/TetW/TetO/TetS family tetracycline resistance ribosomal protection protein [Saccharopolyspora kobensis]SEG96401.1 ribosomal protection tetracycline resistance protein [Saccharopolyspora kobensis]SFD19636.1 ribosomal protection tetracycline resistance protein [Saccharopolyspora kobensis]